MNDLPYPVDSIVVIEGKKWKVISRYFELRKLQLIGEAIYRTLTVDELDTQQQTDTHIAGDNPQS